VDHAKDKLIENLLLPTSVEQIRSFLGHANFNRSSSRISVRFQDPCVIYLAMIQLSTLMKAFHKLRSMLSSAPIMKPPNWSLSFEIMCDAFVYAVGAVLGQHEGKLPHVIYYASKTLMDAQVNYTTTEKELLAIVFVLDKFHSYLL
jgi:hypothetical protein